MATIGLCMIVRDEAKVIERCLRSVIGLIDTWVICDTGSVDGTQEIAREALASVPGQLHEHPWVNFARNRTELMRLARGSADYLLLLDADMTVTVQGDLPDQLTADSYMLRHDDEPSYWIKRLVSGKRQWRYVGSTHEYLEMVDGPEVTERLEQLVIQHHADSGTRHEKFERDIRLLSDDLDRNPADSRALFYLAQTYRDRGQKRQAMDLYERRAAMGGWPEEVFYSLYQVGVLRAQLGDWPQAMTELVRAWEYRPSRLEPLHELAWRLRDRREYETAHLFAARGIGRATPPDVLFISPWIYRWGMLFEYSITAYWTGDARAALRGCNELLAMPDVPVTYRRQTIENRRFALERIQEARRSASRRTTYTLTRTVR